MYNSISCANLCTYARTCDVVGDISLSKVPDSRSAALNELLHSRAVQHKSKPCLGYT